MNAENIENDSFKRIRLNVTCQKAAKEMAQQ